MTIEPMTTIHAPKTVGWKGISDGAHFDRLKSILVRSRGRRRFDRATADRIMDDLRHVAYREGLRAARVFQFVDEDYIQADEDLAGAKEDLDCMSRNLPFLKKVSAVIEDIESIQDQMSEEARLFFGWRPYAKKWALMNPIWVELRQAFQEGRDDAEEYATGPRCPIFAAT